MECDIKLLYFHFVSPFYFIKISIDSAKLFNNNEDILTDLLEYMMIR